MKILMISWEYPPKNAGLVSNHVYQLSKGLINLGHEVHVLTYLEEGEMIEDKNDGVVVHRAAPYALPSEDFTKWTMHLNFAMLESAIKLINTIGKFDVIHCHDWLALYTGKALKAAYSIPIVTTVHTTEHGRNGGIKNQLQHYISSAEWLLTYESWKLIVCSEFMKEEVKNIFNIPEDKMIIIPNGASTTIERINDTIQESYSFENIARKTEEVYEKIKAEAKGTEWEVSATAPKKKSSQTKRKKPVESVTEVAILEASTTDNIEEVKVISKAKKSKKKN